VAGGRLRHLASFLLVAVLASVPPRAGQDAGSISRASTYQSSQVDALLSRWVKPTSPGAAVVVVHHDRVLFEKGYGLADVTTRVPITPRTVFDVASVSKPFTAIAVLMLVEDGKLHYTDSLGAFFPEFAADARRITLGQLLSHTSGLPDYTLNWGETRKLRDSAPRTADNVVSFLSWQRLRFAPGRRCEYSNSNYVLLAQIVSKVAGEPFPQNVRRHILNPSA
jgi:CubicO group peptidase (beta-lactamase class C family)